MEDKKGPLLEETSLNFGKDIFEAQKFLHEGVGMAHNDIHGNSSHRNHAFAVGNDDHHHI